MKNNYLNKTLSTFHLLYGWVIIILVSLFLFRSFLWSNSISFHIFDSIFKLFDFIHYFFLVLTSGNIYWLIIYGALNLYISKIIKEKGKYSLLASLSLILVTLLLLFSNYTKQNNSLNVAKLALNDINEVSKKLTNKGINPNSLDEIGNNALFYAKSVKHAKLLIENGVDLSHKNKYNSTAISNIMINANVLNYYLQENIDINNQDSDGNTALHNIATGVNIEKLKIILKYNPDCSIKNNYGETPLQSAISSRAYISSEYDIKRADAIIKYLENYINNMTI